MPARQAPRSERLVILLIAAVQFINILEFMIVMPLGPDFARDLGIPTARLGMIGGSYTAAAALAGVAASTVIERFDRRAAMAFAMTGLIVATCAAGFAIDLPTLMGARVLAGLFGGPASALSLAMIADQIPPERRGKAMGTVMGSFALASVLGVPAGLELARLGGWRVPFFSVAGLGVLVVALAITLLPPMRGHLAARHRAEERPGLGAMLRRPVVLLAFAMAASAMMGMFLLIPNIAAYVQGNLGYPRDRMGLLYLAGGSASLVAMRLAGKLTDRFGPFVVSSAGTLLMLVSVYFGFVAYVPGLPVTVIFVAFMVAASTRNVPFQSLTSMVPAPHERARYMSIQSSIQHVAAAAGAFLSSELLTEGPDHALGNVDVVATLTLACAAAMPFLMRAVQVRVKPAPARA